MLSSKIFSYKTNFWIQTLGVSYFKNSSYQQPLLNAMSIDKSSLCCSCYYSTKTSVKHQIPTTNDSQIPNYNKVNLENIKGQKVNVINNTMSAMSGSDNNYRSTVAPWIQIGQYNPKLLAHLSLIDILRSFIVLHVCSYDYFVDRSVKMFKFSQKFGSLGKAILKRTFFHQFVGGENIDEMIGVLKSLQKRGISIMMVSVLEEDIDDAPGTEKTYDNNLNSLLYLLDMISTVESNKPILQLKPSTLMPVKTLENISTALNNNPNYSITDTNKLVALISQIGNGIDSTNTNSSKLQFPLLSNANKIDVDNYLDGLRRADKLVQKAKEKGVHILVDAEFYCCKPSISMIAKILMARHNQNHHWIGNTIQGYLKEAVPTIQTELKAMKSLNVHWFGKIVRGAYIDRERSMAQQQGVSSPTWNTYEETNKSYNKAIQIVLEHLADEKSQGSLNSAESQSRNPGSHLIVASHNEKSIRLAAQSMKNLGIGPDSNQVSFAQIYGMADYLSTPLVNEGYKVYKSTPYGPISEVFPYLSRRASENRSVIKGAREEITMLRKGLGSRFSFF